jgi:hypothetical protein
MQSCVCAERLASRLIRPSGQTSLLSFRQYLNGDCLELPRLAPAGLHFISHPLTLTQLIDVIRALCDVNEHVGTARIRGDKSIALIGVKVDDGTGSSGHSLLLAQQLLAAQPSPPDWLTQRHRIDV